jgi:hypothetical protein
MEESMKKKDTSIQHGLAALLLAALALACGGPDTTRFEGEPLEDVGDEVSADEIDLVELGALEQALNSSCNDSRPDVIMNTSYSNSNVASGLGSFGFVSGYNTCGKGHFVQVERFKPYEGGHIGVPTGDFRGISRAECEDVVTRLYVWQKGNGGAFTFVDSYQQGGAFRDGACVQRFDHERQNRLERSLSTGATVKYALTARRADDSTLPVRMATARIVR